ncbi:MAG: glutamine--tRNA ligase/YqeY domain fusion protein, partial [Bacteroidales bacterium]|nr:glutamine--tRNA ligase/YqeY domain fusion protein [Bacteroidales bacterium]
DNKEVTKETLNFIEQIVEEDLKVGKHQTILTRFPPEPNGYLHIGHAKSICLNFGLAEKYGGKTNLRFDDTNPEKEDVEYVNSIMEDIKWLGFQWEGEPHYASDYFDILYGYAVELIKEGKAYVCELTPEEVSKYRGTTTESGKESPWRNRSVEENLSLFEKMKNGDVEEGKMMLRAKIDMAAPNMHMRDPIMYRIRKVPHHRTGDKWNIYPMYDFAHGQSDYIEGITHSICTLEFEIHRPLYDWFMNQIAEPDKIKPRQIEFARLNLSYTIMSKRKLLELVETKVVTGWDDPRMPTISGFRRRGYTSESIRNFADEIGVAKRDGIIDVSLLEYFIRQDLNKNAERRMAVLNPLKVVITNFSENQTDELEAINNPEDESKGKRKISFSRELYIERDDFMEDPPRKFFRLTVGREVRLRYAYFITCNEVVKDENEEIVELRCTYDPASKGGDSPDGRKVKATLHWVNAREAKDVEVRLYDRLFVKEDPNEVEEGQSFLDNLNPDSLKIITGKVEPALINVQSGDRFQFERLGYFTVDKDSTADKVVFNRTVTLRDTWAKIKGK